MPKAKKRPQPKIGTVFEKTFRGKNYKLKTVLHEGKVMFELEKKFFASPSAAAKTLTVAEVNGWEFWKMD